MLVPKLRFKREDGTDYPEWESGTIGDYYVFKNGLNKEKAAFGQGTPIINYTDVFKNRLLTAKIIKGRVTLNEKEIENHNAMYGDVFFTRTSETLDEVGFCGALIEEIQDCVFSGFLLRGRPKDSTSIFPHFAGYYFMTKPIREEIISKSSITTRALTNGRNLSAVNVRMPHIEEQKKIADFLSTIDEVIAQSEAEVQNLEQQKKAAMQKIYSQEVRFKREDGTNYSEWSKMKLGSILCEYKETCEKDGTYEHISLTKEGVVQKSERYERDFLVTDDSKKYRVTHLDDICYNPANLKFGVICRNKYGDGIFSPIYVTFKVQGDNLPIFVEMIVTREDFIKYALRFQQGTVYERMAVSPEDLLSITVNVPCLEEQQKIADFLSAYDEAINYAKQELDKWKELKKGLLQQMFV